ncbi:hypothetical protein A4X13_0g1010 [Tilletia indica]|uniref:Uncharacterized protein n=1 Tax=Tilletia indica TaxID=43049 RepID=A0A177TSQ2_9BASI|nr:hypothetical protein A4X13_0g1010 [Tilletia indica]
MTDRDQLVRDLLPSPTAEAPRQSVSPPPRTQTRHQKLITTEDLQNRTCWICADSEEDEEDGSNAGNDAGRARTDGGAQSSNNTNTGSRRKSSRKFVHPCKCTLVAHQSCLLSWIAQSRQNRPGEPVRCPQCQETYIILENRPWLLDMLDWADRQVSSAVKVNVWILLGTTTLLGATTYGCVAIRLALGKEAASRTLRAPWPLRYYIQIPLIPFALVASKLHFLRLFDPLTPWLIAFLPSVAHLRIPFFMQHGMAAHRRLTGRRTLQSAALQQGTRVWPPNPGPTAMLIPFVRFAYLFLRLQISKRVLRPLLDPRRANRERRRDGARAAQGGQQQQDAASRRQGPTRTQRVVVLGAEGVEGRLLDADPPPGTAAVVEEDREATAEDEHLFNAGNESDEDAYGRDDDELTGNSDLDGFTTTNSMRGATVHQQTVYITRQSVGRLVLSALTLPVVAAGMGGLLASVTRMTSKGSWLRRFLGMDFEELDSRNGWRSPLGVMQDLFSSPSTSSESGSPLSQIFYPSAGSGSSAGGGGAGNSSTFNRAVDRSPSSGGPFNSGSPTWLTNVGFGNGAPTIYDDLVDAPWFRNAIGGLLFIALQDALRITHRYLKLKQRGRVSVRDLPFEQHLVGSLDLRPGR